MVGCCYLQHETFYTFRNDNRIQEYDTNTINSDEANTNICSIQRDLIKDNMEQTLHPTHAPES